MKKIISIIVILGLLIPNILFAQTQSKAYLTIKVNVNGVEIKINGESFGIASTDEPIIEELKSGNYIISASKKDYKTDIKNILLREGDSRQITFELAKPQEFEVDKDKDKGIIGVEYGSLTVVVKKKGKLVPAKVYIDDKFADNAPVTINKLTVSVHDIRVSYKGLEKYKEIYIKKDKKKIVEIELVTTSKVDIESKFNETNLEIDNQNFNLPTSVDLNKGTFSFEFSKYEYETAKKEIYINGNNNYRIIAELERALPKVTATDIGREIKNIYFEKKPEFEYKTKRTPAWDGVLIWLGIGLGYELLSEDADGMGITIGLTMSGIILLFFPKKGETMKRIYKNENYNNGINNKINSNKHYNEETEMLIRNEQQRIYLENAIKVYEE